MTGVPNNPLTDLEVGQGYRCKDTLDRCKTCDNRPAYVKLKNGWIVQCMKCEVPTDPSDCLGMVMVQWNRRQRGVE